MEVVSWFLARKHSLAARRLRFRFPILSFVAPPTDFPLPRFETYSIGENAGYGTFTVGAASLGQATRSLLRDRLRRSLLTAIRKSASRDQLFGVGLSRQTRAESPPEVVPHEVSVSPNTVGERWMGYA